MRHVDGAGTTNAWRGKALQECGQRLLCVCRGHRRPNRCVGEGHGRLSGGSPRPVCHESVDAACRFRLASQGSAPKGSTVFHPTFQQQSIVSLLTLTYFLSVRLAEKTKYF